MRKEVAGACAAKLKLKLNYDKAICCARIRECPVRSHASHLGRLFGHDDLAKDDVFATSPKWSTGVWACLRSCGVSLGSSMVQY